MPDTDFPIDKAISLLKGVTSENLAGVGEAVNILEELRHPSARITSATLKTRNTTEQKKKSLSAETWEVTVEISQVPDLGWRYVFVPIISEDFLWRNPILEELIP